MPDPRLMVVALSPEGVEPAVRLQMLDALDLPNATKFIGTTGKLDTKNDAKVTNIEAGYPLEPSYLKTLAAWTGCQGSDDPRLHDGYLIFCLRRILAKERGFDQALLIREKPTSRANWSELLAQIAGTLFITIQSDHDQYPNLLLNLTDQRAPGFLDLAWDLYFTGAAYAMPSYSFETALLTAAQAQGSAQEMAHHSSSKVTQ